MGKEREIAECVRKLIGVIDFDSMLCKVVSVDSGVTCTVKTIKSGAEYKNIKLNANINDDKGVYVFPKKDSYVLVTMLDRVQGFISMYSDIEKVTLKIDDTVEIEIGGSATVKIEKKYNASSSEIKFEAKTGDVEISAAKKLNLKNNVVSLGDVVSGLIDELLKTTVITPAGPGNINPANIANFTTLLTKSKLLLS